MLLQILLRSCSLFIFAIVILTVTITSVFWLSGDSNIAIDIPALPSPRQELSIQTSNPEIPHIIHQTGPAFRPSSHSTAWIGQGPDWGYYFYNDYSAALFVKSHMPQDIYEAYYSMPEPVLQADYFRYIVLLVKGGLYSDTDAEPLIPLSQWPELHKSNVGLITSIEADSRVQPNIHIFREMQLVQWTIAAKPDHPAIKMLVDRIAEITRRKLQSKTSELSSAARHEGSIIEWTGPAIFTDVLLEYIQTQTGRDPMQDLLGITEPVLLSDVLILPRIAFAGYGKKETTSPEARIKHYFDGSWKQSNTHWWQKVFS